MLNNQLKEKKFKKDKLNVLAIGNPNYESSFTAVNEVSFDKISRNLDIKLKNESSLHEEFVQLGYNNFPSLPNSKKEIEDISKIFPSTLTFLEDDANEVNISNLSENKKLSEFDIIHFSCHGFYDSNFPHLSSLVLSPDPKFLTRWFSYI